MTAKNLALGHKIRDIFGSMFPDWVDEDILMHPREEGRYFVHIVNHRLKTQMDSHTIMGILIGVRKHEGRGYGVRHTPIQLKEVLEALGVGLSYEEFQEKLVQAFTFYCLLRRESWSDEQLFRRFDESIKFCDMVRDVIGNQNIPDMIIIRTLINIRKRPKTRRVESC